MLPDRELLYSISTVLDEAVRRGGDWIACRPGCHQCCLGPFPISARDADRLREGMEAAGPAAAARIRERARAWLDTTGGAPGDELPEEMDDTPCPVLDPESGQCDLYAFRPVTCRMFGPALRVGGVIGACELCYAGAADAEIAACAVDFDFEEEPGETTVARAISEAFPRTGQ